jgi:hypothetical protein
VIVAATRFGIASGPRTPASCQLEHPTGGALQEQSSRSCCCRNRACVTVSARYVGERVAVGLEGIGALYTANEPLARSTVADAEEHTVFNSIPEESDFDAVALAGRELVQRLGRFREHEPQAAA